MEIIPTKAYGATGSVFNGLKPVTVERTPLQADEGHIDVLSAAYATPTCPRSKTTGTTSSTPACRATRLSAASWRRAAPSPSLKWAI